MHNPNGIIDRRSAGPLAPDLVAAVSHEGLRSLAPSPSTWFLVFGLLCRHTASNSITTETHTSGAQ